MMEKSVDGGCSGCSSCSSANFFAVARAIISLHILAGSGDIAIDFRAYKIPGPERQSCSHNFVDSEPGMLGWDGTLLGNGFSWEACILQRLGEWFFQACHHQSLVHGDVEAADFCEETIQRSIGLSVPCGTLSGIMCDQSRQLCDPETQDTCCTWKHQTSCEPFRRPRSVVAWVWCGTEAMTIREMLAAERVPWPISRIHKASHKRVCTDKKKMSNGSRDVVLLHSLRYRFLALRNSSAL